MNAGLIRSSILTLLGPLLIATAAVAQFGGSSNPRQNPQGINIGDSIQQQPQPLIQQTPEQFQQPNGVIGGAGGAKGWTNAPKNIYSPYYKPNPGQTTTNHPPVYQQPKYHPNTQPHPGYGSYYNPYQSYNIGGSTQPPVGNYYGSPTNEMPPDRPWNNELPANSPPPNPTFDSGSDGTSSGGATFGPETFGGEPATPPQQNTTKYFGGTKRPTEKRPIAPPKKKDTSPPPAPVQETGFAPVQNLGFGLHDIKPVAANVPTTPSLPQPMSQKVMSSAEKYLLKEIKAVAGQVGALIDQAKDLLPNDPAVEELLQVWNDINNTVESGDVPDEITVARFEKAAATVANKVAESDDKEVFGATETKSGDEGQVDDINKAKPTSRGPKDSKQNDSKGNDSKGNDSKGNDSKGNDSKGNDSKGNDSKANDSKANDSKANDSKGNDSKGNDSKGNDSKGNDSKGNDSKGNDSKGNDSKGNDSKGNDSKGNDSKGNDSKGNDSKGNDSKANDSKGNDSGLKTFYPKNAQPKYPGKKNANSNNSIGDLPSLAGKLSGMLEAYGFVKNALAFQGPVVIVPVGVTPVIVMPLLPLGKMFILPTGVLMVGTGQVGFIHVVSLNASTLLGVPIASIAPVPDSEEGKAGPISRGVLLRNPAANDEPVDYVIASQWEFMLELGQVQHLPEKTHWQIAFSRGDGAQMARYKLTEGTYAFGFSENGRELYRESFSVTIDNSNNKQDFHCVVDNTPVTVAAGYAQTGESRYPILVRFNRGQSGADAAKRIMEADAVLAVAVNPKDGLWDLFPADTPPDASTIASSDAPLTNAAAAPPKPKAEQQLLQLLESASK